MRAHFGLPSVEAEDKEGKPPISVKFEIPYFTTSGIQVCAQGCQGPEQMWTTGTQSPSRLRGLQVTHSNTASLEKGFHWLATALPFSMGSLGPDRMRPILDYSHLLLSLSSKPRGASGPQN